MKNMNKELFYEEVLKKLKERYGKGWEVTISYVPKNNDVIRTAFCIRDEKNTISPTIYAEDYYRMYEKGTSFDKIVDDIVSFYEYACKNDIPKDFDYLHDWEMVKNRLAIIVVNRDRNINNLNTLVWREFLDLAIIPVICVDNKEGRFSSIKVTKALAEHLGVDEDTLIDAAVSNNKNIFETTFENLAEAVAGIMEVEPLEDISECPLRIMSNTHKMNGAGAILDTDSLRKMYEELGDYYIIPSSIHEILCIPTNISDVTHVQYMVKEVNSTSVTEEEFLSNSVYIFDGNEVRIAISDEGCDEVCAE